MLFDFDLAPILALLRKPSLSAAEQTAIEQAVASLAQQRRCSRPQAVQSLHTLAFA